MLFVTDAPYAFPLILSLTPRLGNGSFGLEEVLIGLTYGSLLGTHILLTEPAMFTHYILCSPHSFWHGDKLMFEREKAYNASHKDLPRAA